MGPLVGLPIADLYLSFIKTPIASIEVLETLPLTELCLERCDKLRDSGLARLQRLPLLSSLTVIDCNDLSKAGLASLKAGATPLEIPATHVGRFFGKVRDALSLFWDLASEEILENYRVSTGILLIVFLLHLVDIVRTCVAMWRVR